MSKTSKRGSTFSSDAQHEQELCFDCASSCFAYRAFRLPIDDCLKGAISRNFLASLIARLASRLGKVKTGTTAELLREAAKGLPDRTVPSAVMDSGVENVNGSVNELVSDGTIAL